MIVTLKIEEIEKIIKKYSEIEYRIINNTLGKNLILLSNKNENLLKELEEYKKYIQEIILEPEEDKNDPIIKEIKNICAENSIVHRNISYINWSNRKAKINKQKKVIAGYSFKGGMGRSTTLAYLAYFYYLLGKKIVVLDCDFEAPGIASIFFDKNQREKKAGILDYIIDLNIDDNPKLNDYFLQSKVSDNSGNLFVFPSGIDYDTKNYINKISKIDFNSNLYTDSFNKLLQKIDEFLKPDLIFVDLRAGINESNGLILKQISNTNLLFFNSDEQNEDGLKVVSTLFDDFNANFIMNSTIRYSNSELRKIKEQKLNTFLNTKLKFNKSNIIPIPYNAFMLEHNDINEFEKFIVKEYKAYKTSSQTYLYSLIMKINTIYFNDTLQPRYEQMLNESNLRNILEKLKDVFSSLTGTEKFKNEEDLKYFYLKDDISKIVNEQIFLILGAKGSGKSTLFEVFTRHHKDILSRLNIGNNKYVAGFSKDIMSDVSKDYILNINNQSNKKHLDSDIERFWKCLTLFQIEQNEDIEDSFFQDLNEISKKFTNLEVGLEVDRRLKDINIKLLKNDKVITLVYDELDIGFTDETSQVFITKLVSFWQDNIYKYSQIRSKILLRNDIFENLNIENKTHLELNMYELKWNEKEILSLILKIFISALSDEELDKINLLFIVKNRKNNEVVEDMEQIRKAIYLIFNKKAPYSSTMDKWLPARLEDSKGLITPRTIYKLMFESIKNELKYDTETQRNALLNSFNKNKEDWKIIFKEVSKQKLIEYDAEYKDYKNIYSKIVKIGQRSFTKDEFKSQFTKNTSMKTVDDNLKKLQDSGFLGYDEKQKKYQVAFIYVYHLGLKINRSKMGKAKK
jgi:cellulose biosynthesis protein BcsQ/energy-coupling factor transporter ATP-binding protein EcfA2